MKHNKLIGPILLIIAAFIWGSAFVAQSEGAKHLGPFTFLCLRSFLGTAVLMPVVLIKRLRKKPSDDTVQTASKSTKTLLISGIICGIFLFSASACQQIGLTKGTEPGKAGFITALYILLVPVFSLFLGKKIRPIIWGCVGISIIALYLLCVKEDNSIVPADIYVLMCAALYAVHILVIDKFAPDIDGVELSAMQFFVAGIISTVPALLFEQATLTNVRDAALSIAYSGIMSSGIAFTFQIIAQKRTEPTLASMLMSLESVFAVLTSLVILGQLPTLREGIGCVLMFIAIIVAQLPESVFKKKKTKLSLFIVTAIILISIIAFVFWNNSNEKHPTATPTTATMSDVKSK